MITLPGTFLYLNYTSMNLTSKTVAIKLLAPRIDLQEIVGKRDVCFGDKAGMSSAQFQFYLENCSFPDRWG